MLSIVLTELLPDVDVCLCFYSIDSLVIALESLHRQLRSSSSVSLLQLIGEKMIRWNEKTELQQKFPDVLFEKLN